MRRSLPTLACSYGIRYLSHRCLTVSPLLMLFSMHSSTMSQNWNRAQKKKSDCFNQSVIVKDSWTLKRFFNSWIHQILRNQKEMPFSETFTGQETSRSAIYTAFLEKRKINKSSRILDITMYINFIFWCHNILDICTYITVCCYL